MVDGFPSAVSIVSKPDFQHHSMVAYQHAGTLVSKAATRLHGTVLEVDTSFGCFQCFNVTIQRNQLACDQTSERLGLPPIRYVSSQLVCFMPILLCPKGP